jgi:hypothetical protein
LRAGGIQRIEGTLQHELNALAQGNPRALYTMLFAAASETLAEFARNPRWLGGEIAATLVLHTWGQTLTQHLHVHGLVAGGALTLSGGTTALGAPSAQRNFLADLRKNAWVVYAKRPFAGPEQVLEYLGRYTHRTAISNERLVGLDERSVRFRCKDYAHGHRRKSLRLDPQEFLRRFALHVLPRGFNRIRHYGLIANRSKQALLAKARTALQVPAPPPCTPASESVADFWHRIADIDITRCPHCRHGTLRVVATLAPQTHPPP